MDLNRYRRAQNEAAFRDINEEIETLAQSLPDASEQSPRVWDFVCECSDPHCTEQLPMTESEYELLREDARRFAVAPGHVEPAIETVAGRGSRYWVVEKIGESGEFAEDTDPRS